VISNAGRVDVGLLGARELVPELWTLADAIGSELKDLLEAARGVA
jgi:hypothetical protein